MRMRGWKTWTGAGLVAASAVLGYLGEPEAAKGLLGLGAALGIIGVGHKIEKAGPVGYLSSELKSMEGETDGSDRIPPAVH